MESDIIIVCDNANNFLHFIPQNFSDNDANEKRIAKCVRSHSVKDFEEYVLEMFEVQEIFPTFVKLGETSQKPTTNSVSEISFNTNPKTMVQSVNVEANTYDQQQISLNIEMKNNQLVPTKIDFAQNLEFSSCK